MEYNGIDSLYKDLEKQIIQALQQEAIEIKKAMTDYIENEIYASYSPRVYQRDLQFLNSVEITPVQNNNGEYYLEIYISEEIHIDNIHWTEEKRTLSEIADFFAEGYGYGRDGVKYDVIEDTREEYIETGKAIKEMLSYLRKNFDIV